MTEAYSDEQAAAMVAAGRLLQSPLWTSGKKRIWRMEGESYPQAVARIIALLPETERNELRELVAWVRAYEREERALSRAEKR